jgi:hypothetical protein
MAMGMLVVLSGDVFIESQNWATPGKKYPDITPINMARKIHRVKYLSRNFSFGFEGMVLIS